MVQDFCHDGNGVRARTVMAQQQSPTLAVDGGVTIRTDSAPATCSDFRKEPDGSWTPVKEVSISTADGCWARLKAGEFGLTPGIAMFCGADIGLALNRQCRK